ncbi:sulfotransferase [Phenylobacterium sp.]|uniref:sulfotransferase family protein n=1 Tax=Phenylobacterium sp. TaxID=1871053 RepID=UPI0035ADF769
MNVFFVCGAPKSGTTWLQRVLDAHPEVMCSGEGHFIGRFTVPLAEVIRKYNAALVTEATRVYEGRPYYGQIDQAEFDELARAFILRRLTSRGPGPQVRWVGDKTPRYALHLDALHRLFPQARVVYIVRDPRDTLMSRVGHAVRANMADAVEPGSERRLQVMRTGVEDWARNVRPIAPFAAAHPGLVHRLRYEDLLADPHGETRRLFGFLDVAADAPTVEAVVSATSFEAQSGRSPGEEDLSSFLRKGVAGDWVGRLEPEALAMLEETCGELMRENGYV